MPVTDDPFSARFIWPSPAKLNHFLHVTGRRDDGYHTLQTVFQFIDLQDELVFTARGDGDIHLHNAPEGLQGDDNLILRAARLIQRMSGVPVGADIHLTKRIPVGGGLGGGSSNAATTLVALNRLWNLGFPLDELAGYGAILGADVPVFVRGRAAWGEGIGERLMPVTLPETPVVLVVPPVSVSTASIFKDPALPRDHARVDWATFEAGACVNDCEAVVCRRHPEVAEALAALRKLGPARLSGTGAAVFLPCDSQHAAQMVIDQLPKNWTKRVVQGLNHSPLAAILRGL
ncbi:4-(cytidine 5'-diphospho)-2-C-methyl-D-erythritol kinase [Polycyclovorans algicola]|uniref:4-(cytidine 5'-diphospho)-2-C-methyl-D-erythritol kinase n=1 Tax=Polycyclovorans algicola TaxID=616992 RepID=UPI0004A75295|nr:4-(cytidine 5'-diphospho)-2-C-methyl-D-erythritol kinase [Polycyclovorans algicola]